MLFSLCWKEQRRYVPIRNLCAKFGSGINQPKENLVKNILKRFIVNTGFISCWTLTRLTL